MMSTTLRLGQVAFALAVLAINISAFADTISVSPPNPTPTDSLNIFVTGIIGSSPAIVYSHSLTVQGSIIRLEGCVYGVGFAVPGGYGISYALPALPAGTYSIQYWRAFCDGAGQVLGPYQQTAAASLIVASGIPTLDGSLLIAAAAILLAIGLLHLRHNR